MNRVVVPELLYDLPHHDVEAVGSRKDLHRLNFWMGHAGILTTALRSMSPGKAPRRLAELGAGDGHCLLGVARRLGVAWHGSELLLVDKQNLLKPETSEGFSQAQWRVRAEAADVFDWLREREGPTHDIIVANLFLHHFSTTQLVELFGLIRRRTSLFVAA